MTFRNHILRKALPALCTCAVISGLFTCDPALAETVDKKRYGEWVYRSTYDELDEKHSYFAVTRSEDMFIIRCNPTGDPYVISYFKSGTYFGDNDETQVKYKIDDSDVREEKWIGKKHGVINHGDAAKAFAQRPKNGGKLTFEARDYDYESHRATYSLDGAGEAISKINEKCNE